MKRSHTVGIFEAKARLSMYVADAEKGIVTTITNRNRPAAKIVPVSARIVYSKAEIREVFLKLRALRATSTRGNQSMSDLVNAGRK